MRRTASLLRQTFDKPWSGYLWAMALPQAVSAAVTQIDQQLQKPIKAFNDAQGSSYDLG